MLMLVGSLPQLLTLNLITYKGVYYSVNAKVGCYETICNRVLFVMRLDAFTIISSKLKRSTSLVQ